jgi:hypothetical protein
MAIHNFLLELFNSTRLILMDRKSFTDHDEVCIVKPGDTEVLGRRNARRQSQGYQNCRYYSLQIEHRKILHPSDSDSSSLLAQTLLR